MQHTGRRQGVSGFRGGRRNKMSAVAGRRGGLRWWEWPNQLGRGSEGREYWGRKAALLRHQASCTEGVDGYYSYTSTPQTTLAPPP